jgi:excinuclease ABC subunit A
MPLEYILVKGAREHNLKNIDVTIPREKLVVITGVSGSGKSTLAFDTIYAEGQRRYVESLSAYARQFLGRMDKPDVDDIEGLSPSISIDQKGVSHNPRSTVGTVTEVYDYLRLLFARIGRPHCPKCQRPIEKQTIQQIVDSIQNMPEGRPIMVLAPKVVHKKGEHKALFEDARKAGFIRIRLDGVMRDLSEEFLLEKKKWHTVEIIVDRLVIGRNTEETRLADSIETALNQGGGVVTILDSDTKEEAVFSERFACAHCGISIGEIEPRTFSFNSPHGACTKCTGLGFRLEIDPNLIIPNKEISLSEGAVKPWFRAGLSNSWYASLLESLGLTYGFSTKVPVNTLNQIHLDKILYGNDSSTIKMSHTTRRGHTYSWNTNFEGVIPNLARRHKETTSEHVRRDIERYMTTLPCLTCQGMRLKPESLAITVCGSHIINITSKSIGQALDWIKTIGDSGESSHQQITDRERTISHQILKEIQSRLKFLIGIGLDYITLERTASTLSGGEAQRIRLATQIGSGLMGVLYVCDEPSVGLHPIDGHRLIETLKRLRDLGNTVLIVEHDEAIMRSADHIIDLGPGAGEHGGNVVAIGTADDISNSTESITGAYLSRRKEIPTPSLRRLGNGNNLIIKGARENNLQNINVEIPLGKLVMITGVSGSGKSSLIYEVLYKNLAQSLYHAKDRPGISDGIIGIEHIDKVVNIDQSPIGRTPRSNPATYVGAFTPIRELFATVPESRVRGYAPGRFSFNVKGGRCEACSGGGYVQIEMHFLPDVTVPCEICQGKRYNREALQIQFKNKNISQILDMTVAEALDFFGNFPKIRSKLATMYDVGLGYIRIGQPATTLSGGEAQRIKLSTELSRRATGKTLYILDEPTTGLSFEDCASLLKVLHRLVESGNTVVIIEHHLDLIKNADWIIDLGPGAGENGGRLVAEGTPENLSRMNHSHTGKYLVKLLKKTKQVPPGSQ